jgi:hypothetical protein
MAKKFLRCFSLLLLIVVFGLSLNAKDCPVNGKKKDGRVPPLKNQELNRKKNRSSQPGDADFDPSVTIRKMINSEDDTASFDDSKAVTITGYMFSAKKEGGESCNCYASDDAHHDIHVFIAPNKSATSIGECVVVEVTPWTKSNLPDLTVQYFNSIKKHKVKVTGWLMYDFEHKNMSAAWNPDNTDPKRATVWEVHPITDFEDLDSDSDSDDNRGSSEEITPTSGPIERNNGGNSSIPENDSPKSPSEILSIILLGALLGLAGQGIRISVGLKKLNDASESKEHFDAQFDGKKLLISILYGITIGVVGGILMAVDSLDKTWDKSTVMAIIASGYAGADFIEGFMSRNLPSSKSNSPTKIAGTPREGGISQ